MRQFILSEFEQYARKRLGLEGATWDEAGAWGECLVTQRRGSWDHVDVDEFWARVEELAQQSGVTPNNLLRDYGREMFQTLVHLPLRSPATQGLFGFLQVIPSEIFPELKGLVAGLELPALDCQLHSGQILELVYFSPRKLGDLAEGLILGSIAYFEEPVHLRRIDDPADPGRVTFVLTRD